MVTTELEDARWHILRYDSLQAATASRAAVVLSADALVLTGVALFFSQYVGNRPPAMSVAVAISITGGFISFVCVVASVVASCEALLALRPWRKRFGADMPSALFYQHNDTLEALPDFAQFAERFRNLEQADELEAALVALWVRTVNYKRRNERLRLAVGCLLAATIGLFVTVLLLIITSYA